MNILLFGSTGRLGGAFKRTFVDHHLLTPTLEEVDLLNQASLEAYVATHAFDVVINATAYNAVDAAEADGWSLAEGLNVRVPESLARICASKSIPFLHFSTDYVFDGTKGSAYVESDEPNPINAYGRSKRMGEEVVLAAYPKATIVRVSRLFGVSTGSLDAKSDFVEIVKSKIEQGIELAFVDTEFSCPTNVDDVVKHCLEHIFPSFPSGIFHMPNTGACSWKEWAQEIVQQLGMDLPVSSIEPRVRPACIPKNTEMRSEKLPPMRHWKESLKDYLFC